MTYLTVKIDNRKFNQFIKIALYELKNIIKMKKFIRNTSIHIQKINPKISKSVSIKQALNEWKKI